MSKPTTIVPMSSNFDVDRSAMQFCEAFLQFLKARRKWSLHIRSDASSYSSSSSYVRHLQAIAAELHDHHLQKEFPDRSLPSTMPAAVTAVEKEQPRPNELRGRGGKERKIDPLRPLASRRTLISLLVFSALFCSVEEKSSSSSSSSSPTRPAQPTRKRRALVAVTPYTEFDALESNTTLLKKFFGDKMVAWWFRSKRIIAPVTWLALISSNVLYYVTFLAMSSDRATLGFAFGCLISSLWFLLYAASAMNWRIVQQCLTTFDVLYFLTELFLFTLSLWAVQCFSIAGLALSISSFAGLSVVLFYDSFPLSSRRSCRIFFILDCIGVLAVLCLIYAGLPRDSCSYRLDLTHGLILESRRRGGAEVGGGEAEADMPTERSSWSFSMLDFCLNRGVTVLLLLMKTSYSSWKHANDCVILKSRVRLLETAVEVDTSAAGELTSFGARADTSFGAKVDNGIRKE